MRNVFTHEKKKQYARNRVVNAIYAHIRLDAKNKMRPIRMHTPVGLERAQVVRVYAMCTSFKKKWNYLKK